MKKYIASFLAGCIGLTAVVTSVVVGAQEAAPAATRTISIATLAPNGSTWMRVFDAWNREVRRRSNRTLQLRFYAGGVQGDESEVIRKIRSGRLDGGAVTAVGLSQIHRPALALQMPGMFRNYAGLDNARNALSTDLSQAFETAGFIHMGWADVGFSRIFSNAPVQTPEQLAAQRPYVWRDDLVLPALFSTIRASAVPMQLPEVLSALQTGRVNAFVGPPVSSVALQWTTRVTHMTDMPVAVVIGATIIGRTQWNTLSAEHQTILRETGTQFHTLARRNLRSDETAALAAIPQRNVTVVSVDAGQRARWETVFTQVRTRLAGQIADAAFIARVQSLGR